MTERLRVLVNISNYFQTWEILDVKLSDRNVPLPFLCFVLSATSLRVPEGGMTPLLFFYSGCASRLLSLAPADYRPRIENTPAWPSHKILHTRDEPGDKSITRSPNITLSMPVAVRRETDVIAAMRARTPWFPHGDYNILDVWWDDWTDIGLGSYVLDFFICNTLFMCSLCCIPYFLLRGCLCVCGFLSHGLLDATKCIRRIFLRTWRAPYGWKENHIPCFYFNSPPLYSIPQRVWPLPCCLQPSLVGMIHRETRNEKSCFPTFRHAIPRRRSKATRRANNVW